MDVGEEGTEAEKQVDGKDDNPDKLADPARGNSKQRNGKRRLAPGSGHDGTYTRNVGHQQVVVPVGNIIGVFPKSIAHPYRENGRLSN